MNLPLLDEFERDDIKASRPHPIGRPPKLTSDLIEQICDLIIQGRTIERSAKLSGVSATSIYRWLSQGREENSSPIYKELVHRVKEATECSEFELLQAMRISAADPKNWRASAWLLERRFPERFGKRQGNENLEKSKGDSDGEAGQLAVVS